MQKLVLKIKDDSKISFFIELLRQFEFIEIEKPVIKETKHDFFASAGLWKGRDISAEKLREKAWQRGN